MTDQSPPTVEDRIAARNAATEALRHRLAAMQLDGPHRFPSGSTFDPVSTMFGSRVRDQYAICLRCGTVVMLNDPEVGRDGEGAIERGVHLHVDWLARAEGGA